MSLLFLQIQTAFFFKFQLQFPYDKVSSSRPTYVVAECHAVRNLHTGGLPVPGQERPVRKVGLDHRHHQPHRQQASQPASPFVYVDKPLQREHISQENTLISNCDSIIG